MDELRVNFVRTGVRGFGYLNPPHWFKPTRSVRKFSRRKFNHSRRRSDMTRNRRQQEGSKDDSH